MKKAASQVDDSELIAEYRKTSDKKLIGILYERYVHLVFGVCMKYLKDEENARDASMAIFEKLMSDLMKHEIVYFKGWLHAVTKNYCLMKLRKATYFREFVDERYMESNEHMHQQDGEDEKEERLAALEAAIEILDEHQKKCIRMFYIEEKSYNQIIEETGYDYNQVKSFIQNGKRNLKIRLEKK